MTRRRWEVGRRGGRFWKSRRGGGRGFPLVLVIQDFAASLYFRWSSNLSVCTLSEFLVRINIYSKRRRRGGEEEEKTF